MEGVGGGEERKGDGKSRRERQEERGQRRGEKVGEEETCNS